MGWRTAAVNGSSKGLVLICECSLNYPANCFSFSDGCGRGTQGTCVLGTGYGTAVAWAGVKYGAVVSLRRSLAMDNLDDLELNCSL